MDFTGNYGNDKVAESFIKCYRPK